MALNVELSVAVTHNYVSRANLVDVLRFLRDKKDEVVGEYPRHPHPFPAAITYFHNLGRSFPPGPI